jgi:hypothetical protein
VNWLELLDEHGELAGRRPADALPCTVGSDVANALVTRAPGVEARHAELSAGEGGTVIVRDLGTAAGIRAGPDGPQVATAELLPGGELLIGAARLRLTAVPVVPAWPESPAPRRRWLAAVAAWSDQPRVKAAAPFVLFAGGALTAWMLTADDDPVTTGVMVGLGVLSAEALWAGGWALVNRVRYGRARFGQHFAVGVVGSAAAMVLGQAGAWAEYLMPGSTLTTAVAFVSLTLIWLLALRLHLTVMLPEGTARARRLAAAFAVLFGGCLSWVPTLDTGDFDAQAEFATELKPLPATLLPALTPAAYRERLEDLERELLADKDSLTAR